MRVVAPTLVLISLLTSSVTKAQLTPAWQSATSTVVAAGSHLFALASANQQGVVEVDSRTGTRSSTVLPLYPLPGASHDHLIVGTAAVESNAVVAYDMQTHRVRFRVSCSSSSQGSCQVSAAAADATHIYFVGQRFGVPRPSRSVFALDAATGREVWNVTIATETWPAATELRLANRRLFVMQDHAHLRAINAANAFVLWARDFADTNAVGLFGQNLDADSDHVVFVENNGTIHVASAQTGRDLFQIPRSGGISDLQLAGSSLFVSSWFGEGGDSLVSIDTTTGRQRFRRFDAGFWFSAPLLRVGDAVFARSANNHTDANNGEAASLRAFSFTTGALLSATPVVHSRAFVFASVSPILVASNHQGSIAFTRSPSPTPARIHVSGRVCASESIDRSVFTVHIAGVSASVAQDGSYQLDVTASGSINAEGRGDVRTGMVFYTVEPTTFVVAPNQTSAVVNLRCDRHIID